MARKKQTKPPAMQRQPIINVSYLRVSTVDQDTEKFKNDVLKFANDREFGTVKFVEESVSGKVSWKKRKLKTVIDDLGPRCRLIVPELSRLGRSTLEVLEVLQIAKAKGIDVFAVKENLSLDSSIQSKIMTTLLALFSELERDFISQRTREALKARKAKGVQLGRPKGPGKSKLDQHREEIIARLTLGVTKKRIAADYGVSPSTLINWLRKNEIVIEPAAIADQGKEPRQ